MKDVLKGKALLGVIATASVMSGIAFGAISSATADDPAANAQPAAQMVPATPASAEGADAPTAPGRPEDATADPVPSVPATPTTSAAEATPAAAVTPKTP